MNLLFITQKVDRQDAVLGFVHRWLEKLSERCARLTVICLERGECTLPEAVQVLSLGKERRRSRLLYLVGFYRAIRRWRCDYDVVLVHMNPIYVVLGVVLWAWWGKKIYLWYNHEYGSIVARIAARCARKVLYTSPFSFAARFANSRRMPAGIDTEFFEKTDIAQQPRAILYAGRISPIKNIDCLIHAAAILREKGTDFQLHIVGSPLTPGDAMYAQRLRERAAPLTAAGTVAFAPSVPQRELVLWYNRSGLFINLTTSGSLDKTTLEAMACETMVLVSNRTYRGIVPDICLFREGDPHDLAARIERLLELSNEEKHEYGKLFRRFVVTNHSVELLVQQLAAVAAS